MKAIVTTGISRGLGKAIFDSLKDKNYCLICISRSFKEYQMNLSDKIDTIELIKFDLNNIKSLTQTLDRSDLLNKQNIKEIVFINNASVISPIGLIGKISEKEIKKSININFISPVLISKYLTDISNKKNIKLRILNISSGAADKAFEGWSMYCSTKSAVKMFFNVLEKENEILVENIDPGVMDTYMQKQIRDAGKTNFPLLDYFKKLEREGKLKDPFEVAENILKRNDLI